MNWGYHHEHLQGPCELLDPYRNLAVASRLLFELHQEGESWVMTAARYHRPAGGEEAARYGHSLQLRLGRLQRDNQRNTLALRKPIMVAAFRP